MTILITELISILSAAGYFVTFLFKIELPDHFQLINFKNFALGGLFYDLPDLPSRALKT